MAPTHLLHLSEPHPEVSNSRKYVRISSCRGGAGNINKYASSSLTPGQTATGPESKASSHRSEPSSSAAATGPSASSSSRAADTRKMSTGIGGSGNARPCYERRMFSFDEELERTAKMVGDDTHAPNIFHVGRGGAGNACGGSHSRPQRLNGIDRTADRTRQTSTYSHSVRLGSLSSRESADSGFAVQRLRAVKEVVARAFGRE